MKERLRWGYILISVVICMVCFSACSGLVENQEGKIKVIKVSSSTMTELPEETEQSALKETETPTKEPTKEPKPKVTEKVTPKSVKKATPKPAKKPSSEGEKTKKIIVIDAGHQSKGNSEKEPIGPGSSEKKSKVLSGTQGVSTGTPEYVVTLQVAQKLETILTEKGYHVIMVRKSNDVNISNAERAQIANENKADAFIRIHCNGSENSKATGALTMCQTKNNRYCGELYQESRTLSENVLEGLCDATGAKNAGIIESDTMSGINWCKVPVTIVEMGFMSNQSEDRKLNEEEYQKKLAKGIADGIETYLSK